MAAELTGIQRKLLNIINSGVAMRIAVTSTFAIHKPRIFERGQSTKDGKIGSYGTKPISISKSRQARQTGKTFFKGGYAEYKSAIGKNPGFVNLNNTGQLMADYGIFKHGKNFGYGFQNKLNFNKSEWMEEKYQKEIWDVNDNELKTFSNVLVYETNRRL